MHGCQCSGCQVIEEEPLIIDCQEIEMIYEFEHNLFVYLYFSLWMKLETDKPINKLMLKLWCVCLSICAWSLLVCLWTMWMNCISFNFERTLEGAGNLSMKEGSLFCFVVMRSTKLECFRSCSWCLWKALDRRGEGCMGLVPWRLDFWCKSSWILNDFFTEKLN